MSKDRKSLDNLSNSATAAANAGESKLRTLSAAQLKQALEEHHKCVLTMSSEGQIADFRRTDLKGAVLRNRVLSHANLQGSNLNKADLSGSYLEEANLEFANLSRANLKEATLMGAKLKGANIEDAGFLGKEFAGADLAGAKLSDESRILEPLQMVEEISKNARKIFFVLLLACVYSWLTIATTVDVRLVTDSASSSLPVIRTEIPIVSFYSAAPLVLIGVYVYFHFYLRHLWQAFAMLPAKFPDGRRLDERSYPWMVNAIIRHHYQLLKKDRPLMARLEEIGTIILAWWIVPITLAGFWIRYLPRHDWSGTGLHIGFLVASCSLAVIFYRSAANTIKSSGTKQFGLKNFRDKRNLIYLLSLGVVSLFFFLVSYGAINGVRSKDIIYTDVKVVVPWIFDKLGYDVFADIRETDVSSKPADFWRIKDKQDRIDSVKGAFLKKKDLRYADMFRAFLPKAILRRANLEGARLTKANFQGADMRRANLKGANLLMANLNGTDLRLANLKNAKLVGAQLQNANLGLANLEGAELNEADLNQADLRCANLTGAKDLTVMHLRTVKTLYQAKLDQVLFDEIKQEMPNLLAKPEKPWLEDNLKGKCQ